MPYIENIRYTDGGIISDIVQTKAIMLAADATKTGTTWVTALTLDITTIGESALLVYVSASMSNTSSSATSDGIRVRVDSTVLGRAGNESWDVVETGCFFGRSDSLDAGAHTVTVQWRCSASGGTLRCRPVTVPAEHMSILAIECVV